MSNDAQAPAAAPEAAPAPTTIEQVAQQVDQKHAAAAAPPAPSVQEAVKQEVKRLKSLQLKVHGETITEELPFEFDDNPEVIKYLTNNLQMSRAANRAMQDKSGFEKQVQSFVENLKGNTAQVLQQMGIDPIEFAAKQLEAEIEKQKLSPEQRRNLELEAKLKEMEERDQKKDEENKKKEFESHRKAVGERVENQMIQALDKSDLPHTPYVADRIAKYMLLALNDRDEYGNPRPMELTPEEVIPLVREDILRDLQQVFKGMSEDKLENFIGKDVFSKVRKKNIANIKTQTPATAKAAIKEVGSKNKPSTEKPVEQKKINARTFFGM